MVVAGDHANNDMAGDDDDSWKSQFEASKNFDSVKDTDCRSWRDRCNSAVICCSYKSSYGCTVRKIIKGDNNVEKEIDGSCTVCSNDSSQYSQDVQVRMTAKQIRQQISQDRTAEV